MNPKIDSKIQRRLQCSLSFANVFKHLAPGADPQPQARRAVGRGISAAGAVDRAHVRALTHPSRQFGFLRLPPTPRHHARRFNGPPILLASLHSFPRPVFPTKSRPSLPLTLPFGVSLGLAFALVLSWWAAAVASAADALPSGQRVLTVSAATDSYPYSFRDSSGKLVGYGVDLLDAVAAEMHVTLQRTEVPAVEDVANLETAHYDLGQFQSAVLGRATLAAYSQPVLINRGDIFVRKGERQFTSLEALRAAHVRIATPEQGQSFLLANGFSPESITRGSAGQCLTALSVGDVDAVVLTRLTGHAQLYFLKIRNVVPMGVDLPGFKVTYCIATRRDDLELLAKINEALAVLSTTGQTEEIYSRWFGRFESKGLSAQQISLLVVASLGLALGVALWALQRQRLLRRQIAGQATQLRESQRILAAAQQFAHLGHWHRVTYPGPSLEWSAETYRIFECDPALPAPDVADLVMLAVGHDRERWRSAIEASIRYARSYDLDVAIEPRPGKTKVVHLNARPVFDETGRQTGVFGTAQDITAPRAAEVSLRRSEQLLRALYANLPLGLGVVEQLNDGWQLVSLNPAAIQHLALPPGAGAGCTLRDSGLAAEWQDYWAHLFAECADTDRPLNSELLRPDLRRVFTTVTIPLESVGGRARICFLIDDVTDRRRQEAELAQGRRLRAIGELVGGIAHEFNNLLTPIRLSTEMIKEDWPHDIALHDQLRIIAGAADRSALLVQRLLTFGRRSESRPELFQIKAIVDANLELLRATSDRRIVIESTVPADLPSLFLPMDAVHQIVLNLLLNARDTLTEKLASRPTTDWRPLIAVGATAAPSPALTVSTPVPVTNNWIRLTVRDTGRGMPPEVLERLFEPFYTTKEVGRGTGLGLATVWHLVTSFGGRVDVESTAGEGSAFHVTLPVLASTTAPEEPALESATPSASIPRRLLMVDDEAMIVTLVSVLLRRSGHEVTAVDNATEAWTLLSSNPQAYDGVILDLNMPGINGVEFARRARALPYSRPMLVMSGRVTDADRETLAAINVTAIVHKPFSLEQFLAEFNEAFAN